MQAVCIASILDFHFGDSQPPGSGLRCRGDEIVEQHVCSGQIKGAGI